MAKKTRFQPSSHKLQESLAGGGRIREFGVAVAVGLFAVGGEEVGPARAHVARHVLYDDGDGIGFAVERGEKLFVGCLVDCALGQGFVVAEQR
jgi:hypothetical protein